MILRTGVDLIEIARLEELNPAIRERFLMRVFTTRELEEAHGAWESLAGRFAVKEAVAKALGCGIGRVGWKDIEVRLEQQGAPMLELHGEAHRISDELELQTWSISISHTRVYAVAIATAIG